MHFNSTDNTTVKSESLILEKAQYHLCQKNCILKDSEWDKLLNKREAEETIPLDAGGERGGSPETRNVKCEVTDNHETNSQSTSDRQV